jgi:hypothetical protein
MSWRNTPVSISEVNHESQHSATIIIQLISLSNVNSFQNHVLKGHTMTKWKLIRTMKTKTNPKILLWPSSFISGIFKFLLLFHTKFVDFFVQYFLYQRFIQRRFISLGGLRLSRGYNLGPKNVQQME